MWTYFQNISAVLRQLKIKKNRRIWKAPSLSYWALGKAENILTSLQAAVKCFVPNMMPFDVVKCHILHQRNDKCLPIRNPISFARSRDSLYWEMWSCAAHEDHNVYEPFKITGLIARVWNEPHRSEMQPDLGGRSTSLPHCMFVLAVRICYNAVRPNTFSLVICFRNYLSLKMFISNKCLLFRVQKTEKMNFQSRIFVKSYLNFC